MRRQWKDKESGLQREELEINGGGKVREEA